MLESRAAGLERPVDGVVVQVRDQERLRASARRARRMGFGGKLCIHPDQVAACNEVYSPSVDEVEQARRIVAAYEAARARGTGAITLDGQLVDTPVLEQARQLLALAETLR